MVLNLRLQSLSLQDQEIERGFNELQHGAAPVCIRQWYHGRQRYSL